MRARGRCTPPIALINFACAPLSIIGQHAKGIGAIEGVERPRARMFLIFERFMPTFGVKCRPFDSTSLTSTLARSSGGVPERPVREGVDPERRSTLAALASGAPAFL